MKFEIVNDKNKTIYFTYTVSDIPQKEDLIAMASAGYKFKVDGKIVSKKIIEDMLKKNKI